MELKRITYGLTVCKVADISDIDMTTDFYFIGKIPRPILLIEMMDGKASMFREYLIFH